MSYVLICDTCDPKSPTQLQLDTEDPNMATLPEGWTTDDIGRDSCPTCNLAAEVFAAGEATPEEGQQFVKEVKKETKKLKKAKKVKKEVPDVQ